MGRIKTKLVKRITEKLLDEHGDAFSEDYTKNKEVLTQYLDVHSVKNTNVIAGYLTKLVKQRKAEG